MPEAGSELNGQAAVMKSVTLMAGPTLWLLLGAGQFQTSASSANCRDDQGVDRCAEEQQRRTRELFGVRSIEEHRAAGDQVRRAFYVDGYGGDVALIAFVRSPGNDPTLWVHYPAERARRPAPQQVALSEAIWAEVIDRSRNFYRSFIPRDGSDPEFVVVCLHGWVYTIEANDPKSVERGLRPCGARPRARARVVPAKPSLRTPSASPSRNCLTVLRSIRAITGTRPISSTRAASCAGIASPPLAL